MLSIHTRLPGLQISKKKHHDENNQSQLHSRTQILDSINTVMRIVFHMFKNLNRGTENILKSHLDFHK